MNAAPTPDGPERSPQPLPAVTAATSTRARWLRNLLRLLGPALLVVVLLRVDDRSAILTTLARAEALPLLVAVALTYVNLQLKVSRWGVLLRTRGIHYPRRRAWAAYLGAAYVGMLTPGRVGDVLRAQYLRHEADVPYSEGLASVVMDRLCDLYVLAVLASIGFVRFGPVLAPELATLAWLLVVVTVLGPLVFLIPGQAARLLARAYARLASLAPGASRGEGAREQDRAGLARFLEALRAQVGRGLLITVPLTILAFMINYVQAWLAARALGLELAFFEVLCLLAIASLLGLLPISVSGVGVREAFFALAFPALGFTAETGVSFGLVIFALFYLVLIVVGFVSWQLHPPPVAVSPPGRAAA